MTRWNWVEPSFFAFVCSLLCFCGKEEEGQVLVVVVEKTNTTTTTKGVIVYMYVLYCMYYYTYTSTLLSLVRCGYRGELSFFSPSFWSGGRGEDTPTMRSVS